VLKGRKGWIKRETEMETHRTANRHVTERKSRIRNLSGVFSLPTPLFFF
jgi:hypothetical protein